MLLNVCKIEKLLNSFNNCRSFIFAFLVSFVVIGGYWGGEIIFMLSKFETPQFTTFQVSTEYTTGFEVLGNGGANDVVSGSRFRFEPDQFIFESSKKIVGGFIEIISPGNVYAEEMIDKTAEQGSKRTCDECYDVWWHLIIPAFLGSLTTIAGFLATYFTQRHDQPARRARLD